MSSAVVGGFEQQLAAARGPFQNDFVLYLELSALVYMNIGLIV